MPTDHRAALRDIRTFPSLVRYLRDEMGWPIETDDFDEATFDYTPEELGIEAKSAARILEIKRLRPLAANQPWGIFFVKFEPKRLPVMALRRILSRVVLKNRASANSAERQAWAADDLLFVSNYGEGDDRRITFAHFSQNEAKGDLPTLKVLGWDNLDTPLHLDAVAEKLASHLAWPAHEGDGAAWRERWRSAFTLRPREVITTSKQLSIRLAELARAIRDRIKTALAIETERGPLTRLMKAFQDALVNDLDAEGFADMYAQTIAYGLLSARIADPKANTSDHLPAQIPVTNPFLKELMETFLQVGGRRGKAGGRGIDFDELGVSEVVELLDDAKMEEVVRDFGDKNPQEDPVIHFYELFLKEYDAKKRMQRGVFYTPRPVVSYIVRSVDELLRTELGLEDGLADTTTWGEMAKRHEGLELPEGASPGQAFVQILDPACGTGTFLVEVIDTIYRTLREKWEREAGGPLLADVEQRWNEYVPTHLLPRLHGYELLMAPYAIAHLKIGLKLYDTGYRFASAERARIYLTNALEPASDVGQLKLSAMLPALAHEVLAVNKIKRQQRFTVVVGNPPYSNYGQLNRSPFILRLLDDYKRELDEKKINIDDDFIKFLRLSEHLIQETGTGVHGMITNNTYLDGLTHRRMRQRLMGTFSRLHITNLHGSSKKKEKAPDGSVDENVFDITVGVAIGVFLKLALVGKRAEDSVRYVDFWGTRERKTHCLGDDGSTAPWVRLTPSAENFFFVPKDLSYSEEYSAGVSLGDVFVVWQNGLKTDRDELFFDYDQHVLAQRMQQFFMPKLDSHFRNQYQVVASSSYDIETRRLATRFATSSIRRCLYRPMDWRWLYYDPNLTSRPAEKVMKHMLAGQNLGMIATRQTQDSWGVLVTRDLCGHKSCAAYDINSLFPLYLYDEALSLGQAKRQKGLAGVMRVRNIAAGFVKDLGERLKLPLSGLSGLPGSITPEDIFGYIYAVFFSPTYRSRYAQFLKVDFPRVPLPRSLDFFGDLAGFGGELVALHLMESPKLADFITPYIGPTNPTIARIGWSDDTVWLDAAATKKGQATTAGTVGFRGVSEAVWDFHIGGYQVCEKWLKDRKGRTLSQGEIAHYQKIVVALNETIRIMKEIDEVIEAHGGWPAAFQTGEERTVPFRLTPPPVQGQLFDHGPGEPIPFRPRIIEPHPEERYVACVPLVPLKAAAGAFSDPQHLEDGEFEWVEVGTSRRLRKGMFVAQVVGKSMEPTITDASYCLFAAPVEGTRQGKTVLVQLRDQLDPETGERYTVKRYESEKTRDGDSWRHDSITLKPINPAFEPIVLTGTDEGQLQVIAEFLEVLTPPEAASPTAESAGPAPASHEAADSSGIDVGPATEEPAAEDDPEEPRERIDAAQLDRDELISRIRRLFGDGSSRDREQAIAELARGLGYERVGSKVREIVDNSLRIAVRRGVLASEGGGLRLDVRRIEDYRRDFLKEQFLASLEGRSWKQREDAIRDLARWLGFRRTGRVIDQTLRSIINGLIREGRLESQGELIRRR